MLLLQPCTVHKGCSTYIFSNAGSAKIQRNPESGVSKLEEKSQVFVERNKYITWKNPLWSFYFSFFLTGISLCCLRVGLELLGSSGPPTSPLE